MRASTRTLLALAGAAVVVAAAIAVVIWIVARDDSEHATPTPAQRGTAVSAARLAALARSIGHPIYWAGPRATYTYELSRTKDGRVYIRYLPHGVRAGSGRPSYLTIGTYPQRHAFATLRATAKAQAVHAFAIAGGGLAFQYKGRPSSVYLAYPRSDYQVEVYDPSPARALALVRSGQVTPVGAPVPVPASKAVSVEQLKALAVSLGHPVYWAGAHSGTTYELTRTKDGRVYVRYLPSGVAVGDTRPDFLTVGTYPQPHALRVLKARARRIGSTPLTLADGGVALVDPKRPTSVYVAYPSVDLQIEVFDPSARRARQLVTSGQIAPVR